MLNEEDHIRAQCFSDGFDLPKMYLKIDQIDNAISKELKIAFDDNFGYLTACPTNIGTGLRASVMLFLPALSLSGSIQPVIRQLKRIGLTVRGMYGEGSEAEGDMFQITNALTLGVSEEYIITKVQEHVLDLCESEKQQREELYEDNRVSLRNKCQRSLGILLHAYTLSTKEYYELISDVKLGICLGILPFVSISKIDDLTTRIKPAHIIKYSGRDLDATERDIARANYVAHTLKNLINL